MTESTRYCIIRNVHRYTKTRFISTNYTTLSTSRKCCFDRYILKIDVTIKNE